MEQKIISKSYFIKRFTALCLSRLNELPQNNEARQVLLKALSLEFGSDQTYTEKQVNAVISDWLENTAHISGTDHVFLRRSLIDYGYFSRSANGEIYRREKVQPLVSFAFADDIESLDLKTELKTAAAEAEAKKQYYLNLQSK